MQDTRVKMTTPGSSEDEYLDDPIQLIDVKREVLDPRQRFEGGFDKESPYENLDANSAAPIEQNIISNTESEEINQNDFNEIKVKIVDCGLFPWYYKKYTNQIIDIIGGQQDCDGSDDDEIIYVESDLEDCIVMDHNLVEPVTEKTQDSKVHDGITSDHNFFEPVADTTQAPKVHDCMTSDHTFIEPVTEKTQAPKVHAMGNKLTEYLEELKHKAEIQKTLSNKDEIDFKRNVGLVGLTIKQKMPAALMDGNTTSNKKTTVRKRRTKVNSRTNSGATDIKMKKSCDTITTLIDSDKASPGNQNIAATDLISDIKNQKEYICNALTISSNSRINNVAQDHKLVDDTNKLKNTGICTDRISQTTSRNQIVEVESTSKMQPKYSNPPSDKSINDNIQNVHIIGNNSIQNNVGNKLSNCNTSHKSNLINSSSLPENKLKGDIRDNNNEKCSKHFVKDNKKPNKGLISEAAVNKATNFRKPCDSLESEKCNGIEDCISKPLPTLKLNNKNIATTSNKDIRHSSTENKKNICVTDSVSKKSKSSSASITNNRNDVVKKDRYKVCPSSVDTKGSNKLLHYYSLSYPQNDKKIYSQDKEKVTNNENKSLLPISNMKVPRILPNPKDENASKKTGTIHVLPVDSINRNKGHVNPITTNTNEIQLTSKPPRKNSAPNMIPIPNYKPDNHALEQSIKVDSSKISQPVSDTQVNTINTTGAITSLQKDIPIIIPVNNINAGINLSMKQNNNPSNWPAPNYFKGPIPVRLQHSFTITPVPPPSKVPAKKKSNLIRVYDNMSNSISETHNTNSGTLPSQHVGIQPVSGTQVPSVMVNSNHSLSDPRSGRPVQNCHQNGPIYDKLFSAPGFFTQRVLRPHAIARNVQGRNFNAASYFQPESFRYIRPNIVRKHCPKNKNNLMPPAFMNHCPLPNIGTPNVHVNGINLPLSYVALPYSQTHLLSPPPPPPPPRPPPHPSRPPPLLSELEQANFENIYPLKSQVDLTISANNCNNNLVSDADINISLQVNDKCKLKTNQRNDITTNTTNIETVSDTENFKPVETKSKMLEELDKLIITEENAVREHVAIKHDDKNNKTHSIQDSPTISKTESPKICQKVAKAIADRINESTVTGYSPPILPIPSTIEEILQNVMSSPPNKNVMVNDQKSNQNHDSQKSQKTALKPKVDKPKPNKVENAKKISLDVYKKRVCANDISYRPNKILRKDDPNSNGQVSAKYKDRNHSVDSDLGYDSDTTVIL